LTDWDDLDVQVYTRSRPGPESQRHYEILNDSGRHYLLAEIFFQLRASDHPKTTAAEQKDVQVLFAKPGALERISFSRPRRIDPLPGELPNFGVYYEEYFGLLVDLFFMMKRYEMRGRPNATKPRLVRDAFRTFHRHFYELYGLESSLSKRARWRRTASEIVDLLGQRGFASRCKDAKFVQGAMDLMAESLKG